MNHWSVQVLLFPEFQKSDLAIIKQELSEEMLFSVLKLNHRMELNEKDNIYASSCWFYLLQSSLFKF